MRERVVEHLESEGIEYEKVEVVEGGLDLHKGGEVFPMRVESEAERLQRALDEEARRRRELAEMPSILTDYRLGMGLGLAAAAAQAKPWRGGGKYSSIHGDAKRQKAKAKRKKMKKHKKRGR